MRSDLAGKEAGLTSDKSSLRYTHRRSNLQSINQSINHSVSQSVSQSVNRFIYRDSCSIHGNVALQTLKKAATRKETTFIELDASPN